jgi:hypothetical protein
VAAWRRGGRGYHGRHRDRQSGQSRELAASSSRPGPFGPGVLLLALLLAAPAYAQNEIPADTGRFQFGPLRFTPWIALTDIGFDTNVFNEADRPKRDFTTAVGPASNFWMNVGRSRIRAKSAGQYLFFNKYDTQRSWTTTNEGRWEVPLARVTPFVIGAYNSTRQRPSYEIDSRARQRQRSYGAGTELQLSGKSQLVLTGRRSSFEFDDQDAFFGATLAETLNRDVSAEEVQLRTSLTPLTTFVVRAEAIQDRFELSPVRDANSLRMMGGFELKPLALISGSGFVGIRRFTPSDSRVPDYLGVVASVKAMSTIAATRLEVHVVRDLDYSFEDAQPYYALTDVNLAVTERLSYRWDVVGRVGWQSLGYRNLGAQGAQGAQGAVGAVGASDLERVDRGAVYGTGVGYRIGRLLRLGFDMNYFHRDARSSVQHDFSGLRVGGSVTYGMPQ